MGKTGKAKTYTEQEVLSNVFNPTNNTLGVSTGGTTTQDVAGDVAHDAADSGNPIKIGGKGYSSEPAAVDANDRVNAYFDLNGYQFVKLGAALPAGTNAIGKLAANSGVDIGDVDVTSCANTAGDAAHDAADSGNPLKIGFKAYAQDGTAPGTAVAEGDRTNSISDLFGRQFVSTDNPYSGTVSTNYGAAQTNTAIVSAPGASLAIMIKWIKFSTDTAGNYKLVEDTGGTPADVWELGYFAANGGENTGTLSPGIILTANKDLGITSSMAGNHTISVGYEIIPA